MSAIYIVLPLALIFAIIAVIAFTRSVRSGQYDDLDTPGLRILHDDDDASAASRRTSSGAARGDSSGRSSPLGSKGA